jgi:hypothetical protein
MVQLIILIALVAGGLGAFYVKIYQSDKWQFRRRYKRIRSGIRALHRDDPIVDKCLELADRRFQWLELQRELKDENEYRQLRAEFMETLEKIAQNPGDDIEEYTELLT